MEYEIRLQFFQGRRAAPPIGMGFPNDDDDDDDDDDDNNNHLEMISRFLPTPTPHGAKIAHTAATRRRWWRPSSSAPMIQILSVL